MGVCDMAKKAKDSMPMRSDAGMFYVQYDPSVSLEGTTPSCNYNVGVNGRDNIASALRKNAKPIQQMLDDWFGIDESNKEQRLFISHQKQISDTKAYCTVVYAGYESENEGEVASLVMNQVSNVIDKRIPMEWNDEPISITDLNIEDERAKEESRQKMDESYIGDKPDIPNGPCPQEGTVPLNDSLCPDVGPKNDGDDFGFKE
jgi:hypothetical protein